MSSGQTNRIPNVLVVEDEMVLRMRAVDIVQDAGFNSVEAVNADEALQILESRSDISLLFTDIQMPGSIDGLKLAHAVHKRWPSIKIVLVSGKIDLSNTDKPESSRFFGKPLGAEQMIAELQDMIGVGALEIIPGVVRDILAAENGSLRLLLDQAVIDAKILLAQSGIDAKEREAAETLQRLIVDELHHRIKNTLATVGAITSQSLRTSTSMEQAQQAIEGRLGALGRAHDLLMQVSWTDASLAQTVNGAIEPYDGTNAQRFSIKGPDISIASGAVIALAMTFNELCTNATKFGALSVPAGRIEVVWDLDPNTKRLRLRWAEFGGPEVTLPTRNSFGTRMIGSLGQQLRGEVDLEYAPTGFVYTLDVPLSSLIAVA